MGSEKRISIGIIRALALLGALALLLAACQAPAQPAAITAAVATLPAPRLEVRTQAPSPSPQPTETQAPSATPDPYAAYTIGALAQRSYGGGELEVVGEAAGGPGFRRYLVRYPSDGLAIHGFLNVPEGEGPFPVVVALHGYIEPAEYNTIDYTTRDADALAQAGFLVLHPNLRGYPPSDEGENLFRVGMAVDVLNLLAIVRQYGGQPGPLESADPQRVGLWGHSMGGGIATRVMVVDPAVRAVVLYGAMSGDERRNFEAIAGWSEGQRGQAELAVPEAALAGISPANFLERVQAAVSIHHGEVDEQVPLAWSQEMCERLQALGKRVECFFYKSQPHNFYGDNWDLFTQRVAAFFERELKSE